MKGIVLAGGSGTRAQIPGVSVAGKTGTAQTGRDTSHVWFIGFAPAEAPRVAVAVMLEDQPKEVPSQTQINCELGRNFPIIVDVAAVVVLSVVSQRYIGDEYGVAGPLYAGAANEVNSSHARELRRQQELRYARVFLRNARPWNVGIDAIEIELSPRPGWLQGGEFDVLKFEARLEGVLAIDFGEVVGYLEGGTDFIRRQKGITP